ncbi:hypothetical protein OJ997_15150 [Solirubrobacter phytolaccae]|uniref:Uncharacterized protein n=1 Tax=Solirubrobacter phytolaccae TaxID=1404360 RepID=A0A9X3S9M8_9ACTN|nr:hypothetical protein [Solirubrobacter phytolaccae]MDA0181641.1 hypothetical protein [Solirubrobacter phytolaccae]
MRALALTAVVVLFTAADASAAYDRTCETHAEGPNPEDVAKPDAKRDLVVGRLTVLNVVAADRELPSYKSRDRYLIKTPVIIRTGAPVVVRVAKRDRRHVALNFNASEQRRGQHSVRFHPCPPDTERFSDGKPLGEWTAYPGGLILQRPRCVTLEFLEEGKPTVRRRVALGKRCR